MSLSTSMQMRADHTAFMYHLNFHPLYHNKSYFHVNTIKISLHPIKICKDVLVNILSAKTISCHAQCFCPMKMAHFIIVNLRHINCQCKVAFILQASVFVNLSKQKEIVLIIPKVYLNTTIVIS